MVEATVTDIVCPSIAADDPDALLHQHIHLAQQIGQCRLGRRDRIVVAIQQILDSLAEKLHAPPLTQDVHLRDLVTVEDFIG